MYKNFNKIAYILLSISVFTHGCSIRCYCNSTYYDEASCEEAGRLVQGPCILIDLITYFYAYGLNGSLDTHGTDKIREAMINAGDRNPCFIVWNASAPNITGTLIDNAAYIAIASKAVSEGKKLGGAIVNMFNAGMDRAKTHLMGHSLGSQLEGSAGREVIAQTGFALPIITACDPARPLFEEPLELNKPISKEDAEFVQATRTDPGKYGMVDVNAHIVFSVNPDYYRKNHVQPECKKSTLFDPVIPVSMEDFCSHLRCVYLMVEWISSPYNFPATKAPDVDTWIANNGAPIDVTYMGDKVNTSCFGNYYLSTNGHSTFSRGVEGFKPYTAA